METRKEEGVKRLKRPRGGVHRGRGEEEVREAKN
jgi:hypothetical protein